MASDLPETRRPPRASRARVLLVDDDPIQRRLTRLQLVAAGYAPDVAGGVEEALQKAEASPPAAIFSDVLMGDADGFELCRRIRSSPALASVPVVLASAHFREAEDRALARRLGASTLVTRTPDFQAELEALAAALVAGASPAAAPDDPSVDTEHRRRTTRQLSALASRATFSETLYRTLIANAREAIVLLDAAGVVVEANPQCEATFGVAPGGLIGRELTDFALAGEEADVRATYRRTIGAGPTPYRLRRADGAEISMEWSTTPLEIDGLVFAIGRDVTETVRAAEALRRSEERHRTLLERIPSVIWSCDALGRVEFVSANHASTCGFGPEDDTPDLEVWRDRIHPEDRERVFRAFAAFVGGGPPYDVEYRFRHRDGRWVRVHDRSIAIDEQDGVVRVDGLFTDVTRQRELEDSLRHAQKMEAVGQLAGGIAHDFNNVLSVIMTNAQLLAEETSPIDPGCDELAEISEAAERAAALTQQLLSFSRKDGLRPEVVDVDDVVAGVGKMLRRLIGRDVTLAYALEAEGARAVIDRGQLEQVLVNLTVNARDAMPNGGTVAISSRCTVLRAEETAGLPAGEYVALEVRDEGSGIPADVLPRIFDPFFTTKEPGRGTGLGLATVYGIARGAGGGVTVRSEVGAGTSFAILLPRVREVPPALATETA